MQIASERRIPRGTSRCGETVSSAVVAATSNPMYAKQTTEAPATIPNHPNDVGSSPRTTCTIGSLSVLPGAPPAAPGWLAGMNGW
ncbi:MAG TPA: hypothetical protein VMV41_14200 [Cellulomonadaceae bacterium]|nr:hypothetical protein [Cellulomonadaceae bacterium]